MTWDVTPCSLVQRCQRLEGMCSPCHRSRRWWQHVRPNCQYLHNKLNDVTCQKKESAHFGRYNLQSHIISTCVVCRCDMQCLPTHLRSRFWNQLAYLRHPATTQRAVPTASSEGSFRHVPSPKRLICCVAFLDLLPLPLNPIKCKGLNVFLEDRQRQSVQTKQKQWTIRYCKFWILFILTPPLVSRLGIRYNKGCSRQITPSVKNR